MVGRHIILALLRLRNNLIAVLAQYFGKDGMHREVIRFHQTGRQHPTAIGQSGGGADNVRSVIKSDTCLGRSNTSDGQFVCRDNRGNGNREVFHLTVGGTDGLLDGFITILESHEGIGSIVATLGGNHTETDPASR